MKIQKAAKVSSTQRVLRNHLVLGLVFRNMDRQNLLNFRLVLRSWNDVVRSILRPQLSLTVHWDTNANLERFQNTFSTAIPGISLNVSQLKLNYETGIVPGEPAPGIRDIVHNQITPQLNTRVLTIIRESAVTHVEMELDLDKTDPGYSKSPRKLPRDRHILIGRFVRHAVDLLYNHCQAVETLTITLGVDTRDPIVFSPTAMKYFQPIFARLAGKSLKSLKECFIRVGVNPLYRNFRKQNPLADTYLFGALLKTVFTSSPKLKSLRARCSTQDPDVVKFMIASITSNYTRNRNLEKIDNLHMALSDENVGIISSATADFTSLTKAALVIDTNLVSSSAFKNMLLRTSSRIEELKLAFTQPSGVAIEPFPPEGVTMQELQRLTLTQFYGGINFGRLPKLDSLFLLGSVFQSIGLKSSGVVSKSNFALSNLLVRNGIFSEEENSSLISLNISLPSVMRLLTELSFSGPIPPALLPQIFEQCKKLVCLKLHGCNAVNDQVFCGMTETEMSLAWPATTEAPLTIKLFQNLIGKVKNSEEITPRGRPFIGDLKDLKVLSVYEWGLEQLTDLSILFGVIFCKKLKLLALRSSSTELQENRALLILDQARLPELRSILIVPP